MKNFKEIIWEWIYTISSLAMLFFFIMGWDILGECWILPLVTLVPLFLFSKIKHDDRNFDKFLDALDRLDNNPFYEKMHYRTKNEVIGIVRRYFHIS